MWRKKKHLNILVSVVIGIGNQAESIGLSDIGKKSISDTPNYYYYYYIVLHTACWSRAIKTSWTWRSASATAKTTPTTPKSSSASRQTSTTWRQRWAAWSSPVPLHCFLLHFVFTFLCANLCFFVFFGLFGILTVFSQEDCTLNHTKVDCVVGYPFLGSNVEVSFSL